LQLGFFVAEFFLLERLSSEVIGSFGFGSEKDASDLVEFLAAGGLPSTNLISAFGHFLVRAGFHLSQEGEDFVRRVAF
jgi:hypothetical protein